MSRAFPLAATLLSLLVGASAAERAGPVAPAESPSALRPPNPRDRHLPERYARVMPSVLPTEEEVASGCDSATSAAIGEMEEAGAIVERTFEEYRVRKLDCRWAPDDNWIAQCRFEAATVPGGLGDPDQPRRSADSVREGDWKPAGARLALVTDGGPDSPGEPYWVATDTCESFVFKAGEMEFDLREMARRRLEARRDR